MTTFVMFFIELLASRFDLFGERELNLEAADPALDLLRGARFKDDDRSDNTEHPESEQNPHGGGVCADESGLTNDVETSGQPDNQPPSPGADAIQKPSGGRIPGREDDLSYPPGGEDHLGHGHSHVDDKEFAAQMTALFILEFGVIFHSIFIGLTLAVAGEEFNILYVVLVFHQTFEGLGLGSRLATAIWPKNKRWVPWILGAAYGITTPVAIAAGLGVNQSFAPGSSQTLIVNGIFDSISAGILIYTGLVELMAHEFMFSQEMRRSSIWMMLSAFGCMCLGAGLMALLGKWA
jgi:zinc transporter 1/2/3